MIRVNLFTEKIPSVKSATNFYDERNRILKAEAEMKLSIALASAVFADTQCTSKGGTCTDYRYTTCYAGYERYICNGDSNRQCCLYCSPTCEAKEELDSAGDSR